MDLTSTDQVIAGTHKGEGSRTPHLAMTNVQKL